MRISWKYVFGMVAAGAVVTVFFQNCGKAGFATGLASDSATSASSVESGLPFAFSADFDEISYNSCFGQNRGSAFTSLQAGAYRAGGIKLREDFLNAARANLAPEYPSTVVTPEQIKRSVVLSDLNRQAKPQAALRMNGNLPFVAPNGTQGGPSSGGSFVNIFGLGSLTDDHWLATLFEELAAAPTGSRAARTHFFKYADSASNRIEAKLQFSYNGDYLVRADLAEYFRNGTPTRYNLDLTFKSPLAPGDLGYASPVSGSTEQAYGRSYILSFAPISAMNPIFLSSLPAINLNSKRGSGVLNGVIETDLATGSRVDSGSDAWRCDAEEQIMVIRYVDRYLCEPTTATEIAQMSAQEKDRMHRIARHLPLDKWNVNFKRGCAVPKDPAENCYEDYSASSGVLVSKVSYDYGASAGKNCLGNRNDLNGLSNEALVKAAIDGLCPQYVSICYKTNSSAD